MDLIFLSKIVKWAMNKMDFYNSKHVTKKENREDLRCEDSKMKHLDHLTRQNVFALAPPAPLTLQFPPFWSDVTRGGWE